MRGAAVAAWMLVLVATSPMAGGQAHEHQTGPVRIATDLDADGLAIAGHPAHFALVAFGDDEVPDFHQDLPVRVHYNDTLLWEQTSLTGHDYDGINAFSVVFPGPGTWRVEALDGDTVIAERNGTVVAAGTASTQLKVEQAWQGDMHTFTYSIMDNGTRAHHVDAWFELWRDGMLWFRTHTHTHDEAQQVAVRLPDGAYELRITGYIAFPTADGARFQPVVSSGAFTVDAPPAPPRLPNADDPVPPAERNAAVRGTNTAPYRLVGTYDPFTVVGPDTLQHLSAIVVDEHGDAVQHVDFEASLHGPRGVLFSSDTLHEYDGIYELATRQPAPGTYWLDVTASRGDWSDTIRLAYRVAPPAVATVFGPQIVTLSGSLAAGEAGDLTLAAANPAGLPFAHGEMEVQVRDGDHRPALVHAKLHTHGTGQFPFRLALPAGTHELVVTPFPLDPQPVLGYYRDSLGTPLDFPLAVGDGPGFPAVATPTDGQAPADAQEVPLGAVAVAGLLAAAAARRRRA